MGSTDINNKDLHHYYFNSLLVRDVDALPQTLNLELLASGTAVNVLDVIRRCLKVAGGIVALGDEDVVLGAILDGLVEGNWWPLSIEVSNYSFVTGSEHGLSERNAYHELFLNLAKTLETRSQLEMVVR